VPSALAWVRILAGGDTAARLYYCTATGEYSERIVPLDQAGRDAVAAVVTVVDDALRHGFLPAIPTPRACAFCDYRRVCGPYEEIRTQRKPRERTEALRRLREMP
jgi:ATP-dependent helicase/nuclease subunit B